MTKHTVEILLEENMSLKEQLHLAKRENLALQHQVDEAVVQLNTLYAERRASEGKK
mgnify:CR=1 FL=1